VSAQQQDAGLDAVLSATVAFWAGLTGPLEDRLRRPLRVGVALRDLGSFAVTVGEQIVIQAAPPAEDGPRIELAETDWFDLLDGSVTVTDLFFEGRLTAASFETWRAEYVQFFTLIRLAQGRPAL